MSLQQPISPVYGTIQIATRRLTAAQLKDIGNTPLQIIELPPGYVLLPIYGLCQYIPGDTDFVNGDNIKLQITLASGGFVLDLTDATFLTNSDLVCIANTINAVSSCTGRFAAISALSHEALISSSSPGDSYTAGDGECLVTIAYIAIPAS